ncbi:MAG: fucose isomerase [Sphaerochaetaceae bacterium]|nr:fucose isomerase [Sphaerochaetaceae bacterium]MDC7247985.1 fucose isomerase [Sphaerochaetaceae bacterium]
MKERITLGVVALARTTFDYKAAKELYSNILKDLKGLENVDLAAIEDQIIEVEDAKKAARELAAAQIDGLVVISSTFHLGHLVLELDKVLHKPILLWGLPELPYNGGKIRLNSVCGVNLNSSNLYKSGIKNYHVCVGSEIDSDWVDAIRISAAFNKTNLGVLGYRAKGFFNLGVYDLNVYSDLGILLNHYELSQVWEYKVDEEEIEQRKKQVLETFDVKELNEFQINKVAELTAKLGRFMKDNSLTALAVRCWPEFAGEFGISPCAAMSILQSEHNILSCEGDIEGALSMIAHRAVGGETPYLFDFSQVDFEENTALLWHCGVAPCNLWDGVCTRSLSTYFAGGKGVTADFVLKNGDFSVVRLDSDRTTYRVFLASGSVIPMKKELRGTYMKARFTKPVDEMLRIVTENGIAHHASVVYGDFLKPFRIFAKIKGWQVIE